MGDGGASISILPPSYSLIIGNPSAFLAFAVVARGTATYAAFVQRGTCWTAGCHEAVHGSHVNSSLRF